MTQTLISIIIPTYNSSAYIKDALNSVLRQTYTGAMEIIVVDDGSTDQTEREVLSIGDSRIRYIKTPNQGNYFARNRGLIEAGGGFIAFLDADDIWAADKLEKQMRIFETQPDIDFCSTGAKMFQNSTPQKFYIDYSVYLAHDDSTDKTFVLNSLENNFIVTSSVIVRKACIDSQGEFDTKFQNAMDFDLWLRIILNHKSYYLAEPLVLRRDHGKNIGNNLINTYTALVYIFEKVWTYKDSAKYYSPVYDIAVRERMNLSKYFLGMEYLEKGQFDDACMHFLSGRSEKKATALKVCILIARHRLTFLLPLIRVFRRFKRKLSIVPWQ